VSSLKKFTRSNIKSLKATTNKSREIVTRTCNWLILLLIVATPYGKTCHHSQSTPELRSHNQITRNDNHWMWKRTFEGKPLVVISQLLTVVTHHGIHASRSCKSAVTHKVYQN